MFFLSVASECSVIRAHDRVYVIEYTYVSIRARRGKQEMKEYALLLEKMAQHLGITDLYAAVGETKEHLTLKHSLSIEQLKAIPVDALSEFVQTFGQSLTLEVAEMVGDAELNTFPINSEKLHNASYAGFISS